MILENHLEQISLSATTIAELLFPQPRIFTNALLYNHDITALIRDTEPHERALFMLAPADQKGRDRRKTTNPWHDKLDDAANRDYGHSDAAARLNTQPTLALKSLVGPEVLDSMRKGSTREGRDKAEVEVDILLRGAERLCAAYPVEGAGSRIASLRARYEDVASSIAVYEAQVAEQTAQLERMNRSKANRKDMAMTAVGRTRQRSMPGKKKKTASEDVRMEETELKDLEDRKRSLEDRISGMERDLGGLLRR